MIITIFTFKLLLNSAVYLLLVVMFSVCLFIIKVTIHNSIFKFANVNVVRWPHGLHVKLIIFLIFQARWIG